LRLKEWVDRAVSLMLSGSAFQTIGPATEKARPPNCVRRWRGTTSWLLLAERDAAYWRHRRPVCRDPPSMAEPCTADNGGQARRACSRLAAVYPTSAIRHAVAVAMAIIVIQVLAILVTQRRRKS